MQMTLWDDTTELLSTWTAWQRTQGLSPRTITERHTAIRALLRATGSTPRTLTTTQIVRYLGRPQLTNASRATYLSHIKAFAGWMTTTGVRGDNPTAAAPKPRATRRKPRPIPAADVQRIYDHAADPRARAFLELAILAGLRV